MMILLCFFLNCSYIYREKSNIEMSSWKGILDIGKVVYTKDDHQQLVVDEHWKTSTGFVYRNGYTCQRIYVIDNVEYLVTSRIFKSNLGKPLFESVFVKSGKNERVVSSNPTTVYRKIVEQLGLSIEGKLVGKRYFGFETKDYKVCLENSSTITTTSDSSPSNTNENWTEIGGIMQPIQSRQFVFKAVLNIGIPNLDPLYEVNIANVACRLQIGYEIIRQVKLLNNKCIDLHMKIEKSDNGPIFQIFTKSDPLIEIAGSKISQVMKKAFSELKLTVKKKWSGYEFFGLTRSEVLQVITKHPTMLSTTLSRSEESKSSSSKVRKVDEVILKDISNIRRRNAGPTGNLSAKAIKARNETIHKLVEFASFGDVTSKSNCMNRID